MKAKEITCDVLVAGAGISGVAAAISASRQQAKTILIEKNGFPGGIAVDCQHRYICGLYPKNTGIAQDIILGLQKLNPKNRFIRMGKLSVFSFAPKNLELILRKLIQREKNLKVLYNCTVTQVKKEKGSIVSVKAAQKPLNRILNFMPRTVIDASGQGIVIKLGKAQYKLAPLKCRQLAGFTFEVRGLIDASDLLAIKVPYYLSIWVKQKKLPAYFKFTNFADGQTKNSGMIKLNLPAKNTSQPAQEAKKYASLIHAYLRKVIPEFRNSRIHRVSSDIHEREGLRLYGEHILTKEEVLSARKFPDSIAKGCWPIEFWHPEKGQQIKYLGPNRFYQIPLGCLKSKNITNLFATGKCISATPQALASSRVMGTCIYLGEAAGRAAGPTT
ncbi:MAG: FAD-dependent oxidoreductase [Candidatus Omnitrophica bacterium]|nr:FAD-dependent oxidoreductase [Candidatus Omnitrophota bacterium]